MASSSSGSRNEDGTSVVVSRATRRCPIYLLLWRCGCGALTYERKEVEAQRSVDSWRHGNEPPVDLSFIKPDATRVYCETCTSRVQAQIADEISACQSTIGTLEDLTRQSNGDDAASNTLRMAVATSDHRGRLERLKKLQDKLQPNHHAVVGILELVNVQFIGWKVVETIERLEEAKPEWEGAGGGQ